ncbi:MAG: hypothetical protein SOY80_06960 [Bacilli bacterium]|nr:hypothetical protein [Bacilli bacterium]MDY4053063.1 hypothetical protein [Bacilli bacterium]
MKIKKILILLVLLIVTFGMVGCEKDDLLDVYSMSELRIYIKSEYKSKFINKEFEASDFKYDNLQNFSYGHWIEEDNMGYMTITLKSYYNKEINKAIFHFRMLKFVKKCERILLYYSDKYIELILKDEYKSKFINKEFEENDFKYKNFLEFEYSWDYDLTNIESVYIYLKKPGKNELKKAIKYYEKNEYVKKVEPIAKLLIG